MKNLNSTEIAKAEEIIAAGLKKAAESLSFFMQETIQLQETDFNISTEFDQASTANATDNLFVLSTELKGNLKGVCYLVFTEDESNEICKVALSPDIYSNPQKLANMKEPLLMEVDNILSASVITQLANQLHVKVYGDVPSIKFIKQEEFKQLIVNQMIPDKLVMGFQTEFISSKAHFHPSFLWILEPDFLERVKETILEKTN
jgi:chemotaxis protein CheY-P-specific phosphatase CheC